ncbi:MAG: hypothetical protein AAFX76_12705 [Planctomycetota bacterium]
MRFFTGHKASRFAALLWVLLFFVVIMPGHRRGVIAMTSHGTESAAVSQESAEGAKAFCPLCSWGSSGESTPADSPANCAICFLKAGLTTPPPVVTPPAFVAELDYLLLVFSEADAAVLAVPQRIRGRAPPASV